MTCPSVSRLHPRTGRAARLLCHGVRLRSGTGAQRCCQKEHHLSDPPVTMPNSREPANPL